MHFLDRLPPKSRKWVDRLCMPLLFTLLFAFVLTLIHLILGEDYVFGSYIDWNSQHGVLPDYFRQKFYETGSLTGDWALELGGGSNPYALAYHGMLNPVLLPSYLFPSLEMYHYLMISSLVLYFASVVLLYVWLKGLHFSRPIAFFASVMLAFAAPFLFHFHKHVMYVDYMPFLILSLIGVDRLLLYKKRALFIVSFALAVLTSFFYSIALVIAVCVYFVFRYLQLHKGLRGKPFRTLGSFMLSGIAACLSACVVLLPALIATINGRETNSHSSFPTLLKLFTPRPSFEFIVYSRYSIGLSLIVIFALFALLFFKKKHTTFLSITLIVIWIFPIFSYAMNAFLYDYGKTFIALIPLYLLATCLFLRDGAKIKIPFLAFVSLAVALILLAKIRDEYHFPLITLEAVVITLLILLWKYKHTSAPLCLASILVMFSVFVANNSTESGQYLMRYRYEDFINPAKDELFETYAASETPTRMADLTGSWYTCNQTYSGNLFRSSIYSSSSNQNYLHLLHQTLSLTNPTPHKITVADTNNVFYATLMGQEWMLGWKDEQMYGYDKIASQDGFCLYHNPDAYSIGFATDRLMSTREFNSLTAADRQFALLCYAVVEDDSLPDVYTSPFTKLDIDNQIPLAKEADGWHVQSENNSDETITFSIDPDCDSSNTIYAVRVTFEKMQYRHKYVTVNGTVNVFAGYEGAFPNDNKDLWFIVSDEKDTLDFSLSSGDYTLTAIELYAMDASALAESREQMTMTESLRYNGKNTLTANITLDSDSTFLFTIPIDTGYTLTVDGIPTQIETIDTAFIGTSLSAGEHEIVLTYAPPFQNAGIVLTVVGIGLTVSLIVWDHRRKLMRLVKKK